MATWIIPLTPEPQSFGITLAGRELRLTVRWFDAEEAGWVLDISEEADGSRAPWRADSGETARTELVSGRMSAVSKRVYENAISLVSGIPLVGGYDLLAPYGYLELGGALVLDGDMPPTLENLGAGVELCFVTEDGSEQG